MFWSSWVIEYSASQQLFLARKLNREFGWMQPGFFPRGQHHRLSRSQVLAVAAIPVALVVAFALRKLPRRRAATNGPQRRRHGEAPIFRVYQKTLDRLAARGLARRPEETPHEYLARVRQQRRGGRRRLGPPDGLLRGSPLRRHRGSSEIVSQMRAESRVHRPRHIVLLAVTVVFLSTPRSHFDTNRSQQIVLPNWRDNELKKRQWISPKARPGCRTSPDPAAVPYFGLDWTARPLQKAELPMVLCRRLFVALLGLSAAVLGQPRLGPDRRYRWNGRHRPDDD